ncbi:MAG: cupin domain-containing protein [Bacteroidota bacterium]
MKNFVDLFQDFDWEEAKNYPKGTKRKVLRDENNHKTTLLKLPKGFKMGAHSHITAEQHFVLKGQYSSGGINYPEGSYQLFSAGDEHGPFESENGALILIIWDPFK